MHVKKKFNRKYASCATQLGQLRHALAQMACLVSLMIQTFELPCSNLNSVDFIKRCYFAMNKLAYDYYDYY